LGALTFDEVSNMRKLVRYCDGILIAVIFIAGFSPTSFGASIRCNGNIWLRNNLISF
jgi:hypothetical protein